MFPNRPPSTSVGSHVLLPFALAFVAQAHQAPIHITNADSTLAIKVTVDGALIDFKGVPPQSQGSRILVPVRGVFEKLGATLTWNAASQTVTAIRGTSKTVVTVGKKDAMVDGQVADVGTPPIVAEGRVMVPLRFLAQALGAKVEWQGADRTVAITTPGAKE